MFEDSAGIKNPSHPVMHDESRQGEALILEKQGKYTGRKLYIESYGCAMNFADSEIVASIMLDMGFETTTHYKEADVIFINTCSIRDNAEQRVRNRLKEFGAVKQKNPGMTVGVLGCMAERVKSDLIDNHNGEGLDELVLQAAPLVHRPAPAEIPAATRDSAPAAR